LKKIKKAAHRLLALALVLAFMLALPLSLRAAAAPAPEAAPSPPASVPPGFWNSIGLLSLRYYPGDEYLYHTKYAYQWLFGFNETYDELSYMVGCSYDTLRFEFNYGGRDWLLQVWKGAYGYGLFTGGEIGLYSKNQGSPIKHYQGAATKDWIGIEFSIYNRQDKLFTRPMEDTWWVTGFKRYILQDQNRSNLTMEAELRFQSEGMAAAFAQAMADKGFALAPKASLVLDRSYNTERYTLGGSTVRFLWKNGTDG